MNITYTKYGDYLLPNLKLTEKENKTLNKYGLLRLEYLKNNKKVLYQELLMKDKLNEHLFSVWIYVNAPIPPLEYARLYLEGNLQMWVDAEDSLEL